jgi:phosphatidylserine/phosphatidylglycerophosphate/cardiolipin synthase-like enzyme
LKPQKLSIGSTSLKRSRINPDFLESAKEAIASSKVRKGKKAALEAMEKWTPASPLTPDEYQNFSDYTDAAAGRYQELENDWWKLNNAKGEDHTAAQKDLRDMMANEADLLLHRKILKAELREAGARSAVQALAGTLSGAPGIVAAYSAYANNSEWTNTELKNTKAVLDEVNALMAGDSEMITTGNSVEQVHRDQLWKAMNSMLDQSIADAKAGKPTEVDLQFYELTSFEMVKKIAESAKAGNKVRLNLDAGRLAFPTKDKEGDSWFTLDATPDKIRTILQLTELSKANVGVSLFPHKKLLGSSSDLMHRKVVRVGNEVLVSGMNANLGSGENVDSGYIVKGKAATKLADNLARDVQNSKGANLEDIWGTHHIEKFRESNLRLGKRGAVALLDSLGGPSPAGTELPHIETVEQLEKLAKRAKVKITDLFDVATEDFQKSVEKMLTGRGQLPLTSKGKELLQGLIERAIQATNTSENLERLDDMESPSTRKVGDARVDIADAPVEREALILTAIAQAKEFIYLPGFVITRAVAAALAARKDQVAEEGKELDVRVIADAALYPHGSTPNTYGVKMLEDHGIQPRWSKLERSGSHDRKIHAKQLITDGGEITGSTNFSNRGLRENWETSAYIHFDCKDAKSITARDQSVTQFEELWNSAYEVNTVDHSTYISRDLAEEGKDWFIEESRDRSMTHVLRLIGNYERATGKLHQQLLADNPEIAERKASLQEEGYSYGDSVLRAVEDVVGEEKHDLMLHDLQASKSLRLLKERIAAFQAGEHLDPSPEDNDEPNSAEEELAEEFLFF